MAVARAYDQWEDPGMAFSDEAVSGYLPGVAAAPRVNWLLEQVPLVLRRSELGEKSKWWADMAQRMMDVASWYCLVGELPGIDREALQSLPGRDTKHGRALTVQARKLGSEVDYVAGWQIDIQVALRNHVTLGRRCVHWKKKERSMSNKIANALNKELMVARRVGDTLTHRTVRSEE